LTELYVGRVTDFIENDRLFVRDGELEIGIFHRNGEFYAYRNLCFHQGGPACEGVVIAKVEEVIAPDRTYLGQRFSDDEMHFVCPWHGYEYDLRSGEVVTNRKLKLQKFDVVKKGQDVYVIV
jgi:nitrite reductase/ring-hydroxylating ferredoxin subunit